MTASPKSGRPAGAPRSELKVALAACRGAFLGVGLFSGVSNVLMLTGAFFMLQVYDRVLPSGSVPTLVVLAVLAAGLFSAQAVLDLIRSRVLARIGAALDQDIGARVYDTVVRLPLKVGPRGDGLQPLRDLDAVRAFLSGLGPTALFDLPWMPVYLAIIYAFHTMLGLTATVGAMVLVGLTILTELLTRAPTAAATGFAHLRNTLADVGRRNGEALMAMGMAGRMAARWRAANGNYMASHQRASDVSGGFGSVSRVLRVMLQSAVLGVGAWLVINQEATAGIIIAGTILTGRALAPVDLAIANWRGFVAARQSWRRLGGLLSLLPAQTEPMALPAPRAGLTIENASAVPPGDRKVVVHDASFALEAGHGLGIIGASASGKSSLLRLLVGVWQPARGRVCLDGAALDQWGSALGAHIGYLPQDVELFAGTVAENIARFEPDAKPDAIVAAARAASVHGLILSLPQGQGYETEIGSEGTALSPGQRQRIALARALYRDPFLVVLDEPNSNLDAEGEAALTQAILGVRARGGIVVVAAHRASALAGVDLLLTMIAGRASGVEFERRGVIQASAGEDTGGSADDHSPRQGTGAMRAPTEHGPRLSIRRHLGWGLLLVAVLIAGVGGWAVTAEISGAVIAPGFLVVDSSVKQVQHPTGGIVGEILARDGDRVKAGDVVVRLDATVTRANLAITTKGLRELTARKARLEAERDEAEAIAFPADLLDQASDPDVAHVLAGERRLFELRREARRGQKAQLHERIAQLHEEIVGLQAQAKAKTQETVLIQRELDGARDLWKKGLIPLTKLTELERAATRIDGENAQITATVARTNGQVTETELQIIQIDRDLGSEVATDLRDIDGKFGELVERQISATDQLKRIDIRAPQDGMVLSSTVHTVGGVIGAGDVIMQVVPVADHLTVESRIKPRDIDQLYLGQPAKIRFSAFSQRTTPEVIGTLNRISADISTDQRSGERYYTVRIGMTANETDRLGDVTLVPGMPVEAFVQTGERKVISYLVKPLSDQLARAFRER